MLGCLLLIGYHIARTHKAVYICMAHLLEVWRRAQTRTSTSSASTVLAPRTPAMELPAELRGELVRHLDLADLAAWSATQRSTRRCLWSTGEVWRTLAIDRGFDFSASERMMFACEDEGESARDFRCGIFRLDGKSLRSLPRHQHHAILEEATHMIRGLMPSDSDVLVEELCAAAEYALDAHDPGCAVSTSAAERLLEAARRPAASARCPTLGEARLERLERAYSAAQQLHDLMESAMQRHYERSMLDIEESLWRQADANFFEWPSPEVDEDWFDDICVQ